MKYSFMTFSCPELTLDEVLATARRFGYDAIEPRISRSIEPSIGGKRGDGVETRMPGQHAHGIETSLTAAERDRVRQKVAASGIALSCLATSHTLADPAKAAREVEGTIASVRLAADVGAPAVRVFGGLMPPGVSREQAGDILAASLRAIAKEIAGLGVTVCLETHDDWSDPAHVVEVVQRVNHPAIAVNWDIMHPVLRAHKTVQEAFDALRPWIQHVHFHDGVSAGDGKVVFVPIGAGEVDHRTAMRLLQQARYAGYLSGEWIGWEPAATHLPRELATMKQYEKGHKS